MSDSDVFFRSDTFGDWLRGSITKSRSPNEMLHDPMHDTMACGSSWKRGEAPLTALAALQLPEEDEAPCDITWDWEEQPLAAFSALQVSPAASEGSPTKDFENTRPSCKLILSAANAAVLPAPNNTNQRHGPHGVLRETPVWAIETTTATETLHDMRVGLLTVTKTEKTRTTPEVLGVQTAMAQMKATKEVTVSRANATARADAQVKQKKHPNKTPVNASAGVVAQRHGATKSRRQPRATKVKKRISREAARELLRKIGAEERPPNSSCPDEVEFAEHYKIARDSTYWLMRDGHQKAITPIQEMTMALWYFRLIHLSEPPKFITEVYTLDERIYWQTVHKECMGYKLSAALPEQLEWEYENARYKFCVALVERNHPVTRGQHSEVLEFLKDSDWFTCSTDEHLVVFKFIRPEIRDKWVNKKFKFLYGEITLEMLETKSVEEV